MEGGLDLACLLLVLLDLFCCRDGFAVGWCLICGLRDCLNLVAAWVYGLCWCL